jgi:hypothetical protein
VVSVLAQNVPNNAFTRHSYARRRSHVVTSMRHRDVVDAVESRVVDPAVGSRRLRRWGAGGAAMHITTNQTWGGGSTLKTARPGQGEPNPAMEATDPITR